MFDAVIRLIERVLHRIGPFVHCVVAGPARRRDRLTPPTKRADFLSAIGNGTALEIGPFNNPMLIGQKTAYFDVLDTAALKARARRFDLDPTRVPEVDFVSPTGDLGIVDRRFSAVLTCHSIEHQPDLIEHLKQVERVLEPGGRYYAIVPDKRYCFDHFMSLSTIEEVREAHRERRRVHTPDAVRAHHLSITHNFPMRHWIGRHGKPATGDDEHHIADTDAERASNGEYVDVHAWFLSPPQFRRIVDTLYEAGDIGLRPVDIHATRLGELEFFAVLERPDITD